MTRAEWGVETLPLDIHHVERFVGFTKGILVAIVTEDEVKEEDMWAEEEAAVVRGRRMREMIQTVKDGCREERAWVEGVMAGLRALHDGIEGQIKEVRRRESGGRGGGWNGLRRSGGGRG